MVLWLINCRDTCSEIRQLRWVTAGSHISRYLSPRHDRSPEIFGTNSYLYLTVISKHGTQGTLICIRGWSEASPNTCAKSVKLRMFHGGLGGKSPAAPFVVEL